MVYPIGMLECTTEKACTHDRLAVRGVARTIARVRLQPNAGCTTEELYRDRAFSIATGVFGFHVATWSRVSRHGFLVTRVSMS